MNGRQWFQGVIALVLFLGTAEGLFAEQASMGQMRDLGGGVYTIGAGWTEVSPAKEDPFSGTFFEPVEETARGVYEVNEGLLGTDNLLFPTWEEIKREGALKKTFHF